MNMRETGQSPFWRSAAGLAAIGFGAVAAFFSFTEHRAHMYGLSPYLFLLACTIMMLFVHHGHDQHADSDPSTPERESSVSERERSQ